MKITTDLTRIDVIIGTYLAALMNPPNLIFFVLSSAFLSYLSVPSNDGIGPFIFGATWIVTTILMFCLLIVALLFVTVILNLLNRRLKGVLGKHEFEIAEAGLKESTEFNTTTHAWSAIDSVRDIFRYTIVHISGNHFHVLPHRSFHDADERNRFKTEIRGHSNS